LSTTIPAIMHTELLYEPQKSRRNGVDMGTSLLSGYKLNKFSWLMVAGKSDWESIL